MKRDLGLCRALLLKLEAAMDRSGATYHFGYGDPELAVDGFSDADISYNLAKMLEAGFFSGKSQMAADGGLVCAGISWAGHDYLEAVRSPEVWARTRTAADKVGGWTFGIVKDLAAAIIKSEISKLGINL